MGRASRSCLGINTCSENSYNSQFAKKKLLYSAFSKSNKTTYLNAIENEAPFSNPKEIEDDAVQSVTNDENNDWRQTEDRCSALKLSHFKVDLLLQRYESHSPENSSCFEYDSHSMLYYTTDPDCKIKDALSPYHGQYCFVCGGFDTRTVKCTVERCTSRYHLECINDEIMGEYWAHVDEQKVKCPRHYCTICFAENNRTTAFQYMSENRSYYCIFCTSAYHWECLPAGCPRKGNKIICNQHIRPINDKCSGSPYCFGCRALFEDKSQETVATCKTCPRAFHSDCGRVNMRAVDGICFYCVNKWSPCKGRFCHVFIKNRFVPAQVASKEYQKAYNLQSDVPVFLFSKYTRTLKTLKMISRCLILPMIRFEPFAKYYERFLTSEIFLMKYLRTLENLQSLNCSLLPRSSQMPSFKQNKANKIPKQLKNYMLQPKVEIEKCHCQIDMNGFKCVEVTCINRCSGNECNEDCGKECTNGPASRIVTNSVEIVPVAFGGFGLQAIDVILEGHPIGEYTGAIITKSQTNELLVRHELERNQESPLYIMHIFGQLHINSNPSGNATRFANHSCDPNAEIRLIMGTDKLPHQILYAKKQIQPGEEVTFDYGHTWSDFNPRCYCGSKLCSGHLSAKLKRGLFGGKRFTKLKSLNIEKPFASKCVGSTLEETEMPVKTTISVDKKKQRRELKNDEGYREKRVKRSKIIS